MELEARVQGVIMSKVTGFVETLRALWKTWPDGGRLYVAEHRALEAAREMAREMLQAVVGAMGTGHCGPRHVGPDGVERAFKCYVERTVETVVGAITIRAAQYYRKGASPATRCPLWEALGVSGGEYSRGMEEVIALAGAQDVYRQGLKVVNRLTGANVSVHKAETTAASWGGEAKVKVKAEVQRPETSRERIAATRPLGGLRMCVTTDGTSLQTTEGWRDAKLVASYRFDEEGEKVGQAVYAATLHYQEDYADLLWHLMEATQASRAEELVWLGDGAGWIWNQQATVAPHAVAIVDFYHASDRLWKVGRALHSGTAAERRAKGWSQKWIRNLHNGKVLALIAELGRHRDRLGAPPKDTPEDDPRRVVADAARYFTNNAERMDYKRYRACGYPIGSGVVESACRHIVGLRMKRTATMAWREENAEALLQLRCLCASDAWESFWGFDLLWRHIRARAA